MDGQVMGEVDSTAQTATSDHARVPLRTDDSNQIRISSGSVNLREATVDDLDACVQLGRDFRNSTGYQAALADSPERYRAIGDYLIHNPDGILLVREVDGHPVGMLGAMVVDHVLSGERVAAELFWFVDPTHRGSHGVRLFKAFEQWARDHGATRIQMVQPVWAEMVGELYKTLGYERLEIAWVKQL